MSNLEQIKVQKSDGSLELFNSAKLKSSLTKAGASEAVANRVVEKIVADLADEVKTSSIYHRAFRLLSAENKPTASKYSLKRALMEMGPSGFPFEHLISEIFKMKGYTTRVDVILKGYCAEHEIDIIAENKKEFIICEAKFHNHSGIKSDLKVALYVEARYRDLIKSNFGNGGLDGRATQSWLITNTKFTKNSILFGQCTGLTMVGWSFPDYGSLQDLIEELKLHPITVLTSLSNSEKRELFDKGFVLCKNIQENKPALSEIGLTQGRINEVINEIEGVTVLPWSK